MSPGRTFIGFHASTLDRGLARQLTSVPSEGNPLEATREIDTRCPDFDTVTDTVTRLHDWFVVAQRRLLIPEELEMSLSSNNRGHTTTITLFGDRDDFEQNAASWLDVITNDPR